MPRLKLEAELGLNKTGFDAGMAAAGKQAEKLGHDLKHHLGAGFTVVAMEQFVHSVIETGTHLKHMSERLAVTGDDLQQFAFAAELAGVEGGTFAKAVEKMRIAMAEAGEKGKNPLAAFGITLDEMLQGDAVGTLRHLSEALEHFNGSAEQTKALQDVFGARGMGNVVSMLNQLKAAGQGTLFMSKEDIENAAAADAAFKKLWNTIKLVGAKLVFDKHWGIFHNLEETNQGAAGPPPVVEPLFEMDREQRKREELAQLEQKAADQNEKNRVAQLTDEEHLNELLAERTELIRKLQFALTPEAIAGLQLDIANNAAKIIGLQSKIKPSAAGPRALLDHPGGGSLGQIGAFTGAAANAAFSNQQMQTINTLRRIENALVQKGILIRDLVH